MLVPEKSVLFISGMQCSGKSYLQGLLRKSPQVFTIPWGIHFFIVYFRDEQKTFDNDKLVTYWCNYLARWQDVKVLPGQEIGNNPIAYELDISNFRQVFKQLLGDTVPDMPQLFFKLHYAYADVAGVDMSRVKYIGYEHTLELDFEGTIGTFKDFRIIQMTKNMEKTFISIVNRSYVKRSIVNFRNFVNKVIETHKLSAEINAKTDPKYHRFVKVEDLETKKSDTLKTVCNWLEINYTDSMLESDLAGYPFTQKKEVPERFHPRISALADVLFSEDQERMGYEVNIEVPTGTLWYWRLLPNELFISKYTNARFNSSFLFLGVKTYVNLRFLIKNLPKYVISRLHFAKQLRNGGFSMSERRVGK